MANLKWPFAVWAYGLRVIIVEGVTCLRKQCQASEVQAHVVIFSEGVVAEAFDVTCFLSFVSLPQELRDHEITASPWMPAAPLEGCTSKSERSEVTRLIVIA